MAIKMPNFKSGNFKQKNKSFKGGKKNRSKFKEVGSAPQNVAKASKKIKKNANNAPKSSEKLNRKNEKKLLILQKKQQNLGHAQIEKETFIKKS